MQTEQEDPERGKKKKKAKGADFEGCKWCQQLDIIWATSSMIGKDVEPYSTTSWDVREYISVYVACISYITLYWGRDGLGQTIWPQAWVTRAQQLWKLSLVWGLNHRSCKSHSVKAWCFCSSHSGLCFPRFWTLSLAGVLQTQFKNEMLVLHCYLIGTEKGITNSPKTYLI